MSLRQEPFFDRLARCKVNLTPRVRFADIIRRLDARDAARLNATPAAPIARLRGHCGSRTRSECPIRAALARYSQHALAQYLIDRCQRFIEQQQARTTQQGGPGRYAAVVRPTAHAASGRADRPTPTPRRHAPARAVGVGRPATPAVQQIATHAQMRKQQIILEHIADARALRRQIDPDGAIE